jgi:hypothetical protein
MEPRCKVCLLPEADEINAAVFTRMGESNTYVSPKVIHEYLIEACGYDANEIPRHSVENHYYRGHRTRTFTA